MPATALTLALFDDSVGGHHGRFVSSLTDVAVARGHRVLVFHPEPPGPGAAVWHAVAERRVRDVRAGRRTLAAVGDTCRRAGVDVLVDLGLDTSVLALPRRPLPVPARVHVLHQVTPYAYEGRTWRGRVRTAASRRRLRTLTRNGDVVVVHTALAAARLAALRPPRPDRVVQARLPACRETEVAAPRSDPAHGVPRLLFVGRSRGDKGLDDLLEALGRCEGRVALDVVGGPQPGRVVDDARRRHSALDVTWTDRRVTDEEIAAAHARASLLALPYRMAFRDSGGASAALLDGLRFGVPIVTTTALASQLPEGYGGATVAEAGDVASLAKAIDRAVADLPALAAAAAEQGPAHVRGGHTFEAYLDALLASADHTAPRQTGGTD